MCFVTIFSQSVVCLFVFIMETFEERKFLMFSKSNILVVSFRLCCMKSVAKPRVTKIFSEKFHSFRFYIKGYNYVELIFVYEIRV